MLIKQYTFCDSDLTGFANDVREVVLCGLDKQSLLNGDLKEIISTTAIVVKPKGLFGRMFDKIRGIKDDKAIFLFVKVLPLSEVEVKDPDHADAGGPSDSPGEDEDAVPDDG